MKNSSLQMNARKTENNCFATPKSQTKKMTDQRGHANNC